MTLKATSQYEVIDRFETSQYTLMDHFATRNVNIQKQGSERLRLRLSFTSPVALTFIFNSSKILSLKHV